MRTRPSIPTLGLLLVSLLLGSPTASGQADVLETWQAKAVAKAEKAATKGAKQTARLEQKRQALESRREARLQALASLGEERATLLVQLDQHETALAEALALSDDEPAKAALVKDAQQAVASVQQALSKLAGAEARLVAQLAKLDHKLAKLAARLDDAQLGLEHAQQDLAALAEGFGFGGFAAFPLELAVRGPDGPLPGAFVSVHVPLVPPKKGKLPLGELTRAGPWFSGRTGPDGSLQALVSLPTELSHVDVSVHAPGLGGEYTHEALRELLGVFAPSARVVRSRHGLQALDFELTLLAPTP